MRPRIPWLTLTLILGLHLLGASGRSSNADVELMLGQARGFLAGHIHLPEGAADSRGSVGVGGHLYSHFGAVAPILWTPFLAVGRGLAHVVGRMPLNAWEEFTVSFAPALTLAAVLAGLARWWLDAGVSMTRVKAGLWVFGFASLLWPYSKLLGSDLIMALFLLLGMLAWRRHRSSRDALLAGVLWGLAYLTRKQFVTLIPWFTLWVAWETTTENAFKAALSRWRTAVEKLFAVMLGFLPAIGLKLVWNKARFGGWLDEPYPGAEKAFSLTWKDWVDRVIEELLEERRGHVYFNILLIVLLGLVTSHWWRRERSTCALVYVCGGVTIAFLALFDFWSGGTSFGPRLALFMVPLVALGWAWLPERLPRWQAIVLALGIAANAMTVTPGVVCDPLAIDKRAQWQTHPRAPGFIPGWREIFTVTTGRRPPLPPGLDPSAYTLETHAPWQVPDFWWVHAWQVLRRSANSNAQPAASPAPN
jgi:hypothetical protein